MGHLGFCKPHNMKLKRQIEFLTVLTLALVGLAVGCLGLGGVHPIRALAAAPLTSASPSPTGITLGNPSPVPSPTPSPTPSPSAVPSPSPTVYYLSPTPTLGPSGPPPRFPSKLPPGAALIGPQGGLVRSADGQALLAFAPGVLLQEIEARVYRVKSSTAPPGLYPAGAAYSFVAITATGQILHSFNGQPSVSVPANNTASDRLFWLDGNAWQPEGALIQFASLQAPVGHLGIYQAFGPKPQPASRISLWVAALGALVVLVLFVAGKLWRARRQRAKRRTVGFPKL